MRVRMLIHISGFRNGQEWPTEGGVIDLPDGEAQDLIATGYAEEASDAEPTDPTPAGPPAPPAPGPDGEPTSGPGERPASGPGATGDLTLTVDDVAQGKVDAVVAWIDGSPTRAVLALAAEKARAKPRAGVVDHAHDLLLVDAITDWVGDDPARAAEVLALEQLATEPRVTLLDHLRNLAG